MCHSCKTQERSFWFHQRGRRWSKIAWTCTMSAVQQTGIYSCMLLLLLHHCHQWPASTAEVWIQNKSITKLLKAELNVNRGYTYLQIAWPQIHWAVWSIVCNVSSARKLVLETWLLHLPLRQSWQLVMDHVAFYSPWQPRRASLFPLIGWFL